MKRVVCVLVLAAASLALAGANIYPDPSFERTGERGPARTGKRAGHLKVHSRVHWTSVSKTIRVEPFATYRATAYVRARTGKGALHGLYCYTWNSFDWAWVSSVRLNDIPEWKKIEVTFMSPNHTMAVCPLAAFGAENCEAWVDDVVIEKIRSPEDNIKAFLAKPPTDRDSFGLHARIYLARGDVAKMRALAAKGNNYAKADVACLLAQRAKDPAERLRLVAEMVGYGALNYGNGKQRFEELTRDLSRETRQAVFLNALQATQFAAPAAASYVGLMSTRLDEAIDQGTCRQAEALVDQIAGQLAALLKTCPPKASGRKELEKMNAKLAAARNAVAARRAALGKCVIQVGNKPLAAATHAIVTPDKPTPQEEFAATDLQALLEKLTGHELPIVADAALADQVPVVVGKCTKTLAALGVTVPFDTLGLETIVIRTHGPALILSGNKRGVLYAVYSFLEDYCNCRWFTPDCTVLPKTGTFKVRNLDVRYTPPLEYRATDYPKSRPANWAVRNKLNGTQTALDDKRGGKIAYSHFVHTFHSILSADEHFDEHPEWFSMVKGKRISNYAQLCLTNPEVLEAAKKAVRKWIKQAPDATIFSVSQNDWRNPCECPACAALDEKEGTHAGTMIHLVNAVARDIAADHPDKLISTLAYQYTRTPTKHVRPEPNVTVRLCTIECDFARPLDKSSHPQNIKFVKDIKGWARKCNRLYIWDYIIDYGHSVMPWPNLYALQGNIKFFINNGVKGLYEEACYFTKGSEFAELRTWIIAKQMWNPDYDTDRAIDEFCQAYYGAAGMSIRRYINLIHAPVLKDPKMYIHIWAPPTSPYLTKDVIHEAVRLFNEAEHMVREDPVRLHRVQVARLPIMYVRIATARSGYQEKGNALVASTTTDVRKLVKRFEQIARKEGLTRIRESRRTGNLDTWLESLNLQSDKLPIVRLSNPTLDLAIIPAIGGRIWKMTHKPTGRDILKRYQNKDGSEVPDMSGYEEFTEGDYHTPGWNENYRVVKKSATAITLEAKLRNGLRITRTIALDAKKPLVTIDSTLTNTTKSPRKACLRSHPGFAVADVQKAAAWLRQADGSWKKVPLALKDKTEHDEFFTGNAVPAGDWMILDGTADLGIRNRFDPAQVGQCLLNRNRPDRRVNLELYTKPTTLAPGKSQRLKHTLEVVPNASATK